MKRFAALCVLVASFAAYSPATASTLQVFAAGGLQAQGIVPSPSGQHFIIVNTNGRILSIPSAAPGNTPWTPTELALVPIDPTSNCIVGDPVARCVSLRDGTFLPPDFGPLAGRFLTVGGRATTNSPAYASIVGGPLGYATQGSSLWSSTVVAAGFGKYKGGVLVLNQGSGQGLRNGSLDYFDPEGGPVQRIVDLPEVRVPYGATLATVGANGEVGGSLLVTDAQSGDIVKVNQNGKVTPFASLPVAGLRQIAVAPAGWGAYTNHIFVSAATNQVLVLDRAGALVGKIEGVAVPRALLFTEFGGVPSLLIGETSSAGQLIYRAGPEHIVPVQ